MKHHPWYAVITKTPRPSKGRAPSFLGKLQQSVHSVHSTTQVLTIGGLSTGTQAMAIKKGCHMVIATQQKSNVSLKIWRHHEAEKNLCCFPYLFVRFNQFLRDLFGSVHNFETSTCVFYGKFLPTIWWCLMYPCSFEVHDWDWHVFGLVPSTTLLGTNISHQRSLLKMIFRTSQGGIC